jgi:hypothetical protein
MPPRASVRLLPLSLTLLCHDAHSYNQALCLYKQKQYGPALKLIAEIIERGVREHPELSVGSNTDGVEVRSVGNSGALKETALIEAFNLKAAIEFQVKNCTWRQLLNGSVAA